MFQEKQHFSGLILSHPKIGNVADALENFFTFKIDSQEMISSAGNGSVIHFRCLSEKVYHKGEDLLISGVKRAKTKKINGITYYLYNCYLLWLRQDEGTANDYFLFAAPFKKMLKDVIDSRLLKLKSQKASFAYIEIPLLINNLKETEKAPLLYITRMNIQSVASSGIKSIALYGDDIVLSPQFNNFILSGKPSSVRLVYNTGELDQFSVNTDRFGNWSFYLKNQTEITKFHNIFSYFHDNKVLKKTFNDPRDRRTAGDDRLEIE
jgi:hypothetical protein